MPLAEAHLKCRHQWMRDALQEWVSRRGWLNALDGQVAVGRTGSSVSDSSS
jgi:hypothetical protein